MMIAGMVKEHGLFPDVFCFFAQNLKSKKAVVAVVSAITGLLSIKGRVTVSAGILDTLAPDKGCCGREKFGLQLIMCTPLLFLVLEKTVIPSMAAFGLSYTAFMGMSWFLLAVHQLHLLLHI